MELVGMMNNIDLTITGLTIAIFICVIIILIVITKHQISEIKNLSETTLVLHNSIKNHNQNNEYDNQEKERKEKKV